MTGMTRRTRNLSDLQREIDRLFGRFSPSQDQDRDRSSRQSVWAPRMDLLETEEAYRIRLDVPGMSKDDLTINYQDNELTVSGERTSNRPEDEAEYVRVERPFGYFHRTFSLPQTVDATGIQATYENGVLTLTVPKSEDVKPRQIEIQ